MMFLERTQGSNPQPDARQRRETLRSKGEDMSAQQQYDSLDDKQKRDLLLRIGETREEARALSQRDYDALGAWVKTRLKRFNKHRLP
jgi:hypothetical protein